jgi:endonuclease YncB( thermonuclease family)
MARHLLIILAALLSFGFLPGCGVRDEPTSAPPSAVVSSPTASITSTLPPTWTPRLPTPTNTRVIPIPPTFTPGPSPTPTRLPGRSKGLVVGIQDSRTIEVVIEGQPISRVFVVRLLGIEPPLLSDPWAGVAVEWLTQEIGRQVVVLESDKLEQDDQGNLLRYVWKEGLMINVTMVQMGLATASEEARDLNYSADLLDAEASARNAKRGLWGPPPTTTPTLTSTATLTTTQVPTATLVATQTPTVTLRPTSSP